MTRRSYESELSMEPLVQAAQRLGYLKDGTGTMMAFPPYLIPKGLPLSLEAAVEEIELRRDAARVGVMVNILPPGLTVKVHVDPLPKHYPHGGKVERWHLCIHSDLKAWMLQVGEEKAFPYPGFWYGPLRYWMPHQVGNDSETVARVHLIVDLDKEGPL